jgi:hypothetical protein
VATPELFPEVRDLLEQHAGTEALQPLHDLADTLWQVTENPEVAMVACPLPGAYRQFPLHGNLAEEIADLENPRPDMYWLPEPSGSSPSGSGARTYSAAYSGRLARDHMSPQGLA